MVAQIIFFFAVALFLVLLLRRANLLENIWQFIRSLADMLGGGLKNFSAKSREQLKNRSNLPNLKFPPVNLERFRRSRPQPGVHVEGDPEFWQEELLEEKAEIMSHYDEGENLFRAGQYDEAEKFFLTAATRNPKDPKVYARLGLIYLNKKSYSDAIEALKVAVKIDKYNPTRHYNLALAYAGKEDNQRAIATIREAISLDPVSQRYRTLLEQLLNKK